MKIHNILLLAAITLVSSGLHAGENDKNVERARRLNEQFTQPPQQSTGTVRTSEQAIIKYRESGKSPGVSFKTKPVPPPGK